MIVLFVGPGGSGKTVMAINLGILMGRMGYNTLLVDGDIYLPDMTEYLDMGAVRVTLHTLLKDPLVEPEAALYKLREYGVSVLPGSKELGQVVGAHTSLLIHVFEELSKEYALTFVDTPSGLPMDLLELYEIATHQVVVLDVERAGRGELPYTIHDQLEKYLFLDREERMEHGVILNNVQKVDPALIEDYIEETFEVPVLGVVPYDPHVPESVSLRRPLIVEFPHSDAAIAIKDAGKVIERWLFG